MSAVVRSAIGTQITASSHARRSLVALGDGLVLSLFVAAGLLSHAIHPLTYPVHAVLTALPFLVGWAVVAPFGAVYAPETLRSVRATAVRVCVVWTAASLVGAGLRATPLFHGGSPPEFVLVNVVFGIAFLLPWRMATVAVARRRGW